MASMTVTRNLRGIRHATYRNFRRAFFQQPDNPAKAGVVLQAGFNDVSGKVPSIFFVPSNQSHHARGTSDSVPVPICETVIFGPPDFN